jgi:hypothetical protein
MVLLHKSNRLVLQVFEEDGTLSLRSVAKYLIQISKSRILKDNLRCACHYMYECPNFLPEDLPLRLQLCQWLQQQHEANQNFIEIILFKDECLSSREATFNNHNYHVWAEQNPHEIHVNALIWHQFVDWDFRRFIAKCLTIE